MASSYGEDASKDALREAYRLAESSLTPRHRERVDAELLRNLLAHPVWHEASLVLAYLPLHEEFDTCPIIAQALKEGKRVALARLAHAQGAVEYVLIGSLDDLERTAWQGREALPLDLRPGDGKGALCLVPGLVFDGHGHRVGYGAGYYDNFLAGFSGTKLGLVRSMQISSNPLPAGEHDVAVDLLVSESCVWSCR